MVFATISGAPREPNCDTPKWERKRRKPQTLKATRTPKRTRCGTQRRTHGNTPAKRRPEATTGTRRRKGIESRNEAHFVIHREKVAGAVLPKKSCLIEKRGNHFPRGKHKRTTFEKVVLLCFSRLLQHHPGRFVKTN